MSYFYNPLLRFSLQKDQGGSGSDPDYDKIKGSLIKGYVNDDNSLAASYPVCISAFSDTGVINYASRRGYAREIIQTKSLVLEYAGTAIISGYPVMTGTTSGLSYLSEYEYLNLIGSKIGSKILGSQITGYNSGGTLITGSIITSGLEVCISTGGAVEKVPYSNFFSSIDGESLGTISLGVTGYTAVTLFATIQENSGKTIERLHIGQIRDQMLRSIPAASSSMLSGVTDVYIKLGSDIRSLSKADFKTWLNM